VSHVPGAVIEEYLGRVNVHFIKETWSSQDGGGVGTFAHTFLTEANAIARAQVLARGGNGLVGYTLRECRIIEQKVGQAYSIASVVGDAVRLRPIEPRVLEEL
jgi:hypothetical protein